MSVLEVGDTVRWPMTTPGDTTMASLAEVEKIVAGADGFSAYTGV
jgi:hypothetical protein